MKVWIRAVNSDVYEFAVQVSFRKRAKFSSIQTRTFMALLLRGSGVRLPKHGSDDVVCVELTAKKVKK